MDTIKLSAHKFVVLCGIVLTVLFGFGCNEEPENVEDTSIVEPADDGTVHQLAQMIAASTVSGEGRSFIKEEVAKRFDGDYNFLFAEAISKPVTGSGTLKSTGSSGESYGNFLARYAQNESGLKSTSTDMTAFYATIEEQFPLLQVAIPFYDEESVKVWENGVKPLVAVLDSDYDDQTTKTIVAYDSDGNVHTLDATKAPEMPVIVISPNERLIVVPKTGLKAMAPIGKIYFETSTHLYYLRQNMDTPYADGYGPSNPIAIQNPSTTTCDRDLNPNKDYLSKAEFVSEDALRVGESWANGDAEVYVIITYADQNGTYTLEKDCGSGWCDRGMFGQIKKLHQKPLDEELFTWIYTQMGDRMKYTFMERDNTGATISFETSLTSNIPLTNDKDGIKLAIGGKATVQIPKNDDKLCESIVEYKDPTAGEGTKYTTGIMRFWINQK